MCKSCAVAFASVMERKAISLQLLTRKDSLSSCCLKRRLGCRRRDAEYVLPSTLAKATSATAPVREGGGSLAPVFRYLLKL